LTLPNDYKDDEEDENSSELDEMELNDWWEKHIKDGKRQILENII
jgi:hypothetical protein